MPAAFCGVVGVKATHGLASIRGIIPLSETHDHVGPLCRNVVDSAILLTAISGFDRLDPVCGLDPQLANDYRENGAGTVKDHVVENGGAWRHSATKYLRQPIFRDSLRGMLGL